MFFFSLSLSIFYSVLLNRVIFFIALSISLLFRYWAPHAKETEKLPNYNITSCHIPLTDSHNKNTIFLWLSFFLWNFQIRFLIISILEIVTSISAIQVVLVWVKFPIEIVISYFSFPSNSCNFFLLFQLIELGTGAT